MINMKLALQIYRHILGHPDRILSSMKDLVYYWIGVTENPAYYSGAAIVQTKQWCKGVQLRLIGRLETEPLRPIDLSDWDDSVVRLLRSANLVDLGSALDIVPSTNFVVIVMTPTSRVHIDGNRILPEQ